MMGTFMQIQDWHAVFISSSCQQQRYCRPRCSQQMNIGDYCFCQVTGLPTSCGYSTHLHGRISVRPGEPMVLLLAVMGSNMLGEAHQPGRALPLSGYTWSSGHEPDSDACRKQQHVM
jgi:hypothetical protein